MKGNPFFEIKSEWEYALANYGQDLPWQILIENCHRTIGLIVKAVEETADGFKLSTDQGELAITPTSRWRIKLGRTAKKKIIFTHYIE